MLPRSLEMAYQHPPVVLMSFSTMVRGHWGLLPAVAAVGDDDHLMDEGQ